MNLSDFAARNKKKIIFLFRHSAIIIVGIYFLFIGAEYYDLFTLNREDSTMSYTIAIVALLIMIWGQAFSIYQTLISFLLNTIAISAFFVFIGEGRFNFLSLEHNVYRYGGIIFSGIWVVSSVLELMSNRKKLKVGNNKQLVS